MTVSDLIPLAYSCVLFECSLRPDACSMAVVKMCTNIFTLQAHRVVYNL